jgi:hypothetical protein
MLAGSAIAAVMVMACAGMIAAEGPLTVTISFGEQTLAPFAATVVLLAAGAMTEEAMLRGYPFQRLIEVAGPAAAVAVTSVLFASLHFLNPHFDPAAAINTGLMGVLLGVAYLRTSSLWLPWAIHFGWNFVLGVVLGLPVSGITMFAVLGHGSAGGPLWATGGAYGIEASWSATGVVCAGIGLTWAATRWSRLRNLDSFRSPEVRHKLAAEDVAPPHLN